MLRVDPAWTCQSIPSLAGASLWQLSADSSSPQLLPVASLLPSFPSFPSSRGLFFDGVTRPTLWCNFGSPSSPSILNHVENESRRRIQRAGLIGMVPVPGACPLPPRGIFSRTAARNTQGILTEKKPFPFSSPTRTRGSRISDWLALRGALRVGGRSGRQGKSVKRSIFKLACLCILSRALHPPFPCKDCFFFHPSISLI